MLTNVTAKRVAANRKIFWGWFFFCLGVAAITVALTCLRVRRTLPRGGGLVVDDVTSAVRTTEAVRGHSGLKSGSWIRLRIITVPALGAADESAKRIKETRQGLVWLKERGIRVCALIRLPLNDWTDGSLSKDLDLIHEQAKRLAGIYGDAVEAWEIDNEPDLGFVPDSAENYAAFLKAAYLGLKAGAREARAQLPEAGYSLSGPKPNNQQPTADNSNDPTVIMGSLGLPAGPWLERFVANDGFAYTDGFNYHYYGYAEDFTGVYQQHEAAVIELTRQNLPNGSGNSVRSVEKDLPVFLTEVGYGMLGKRAMNTKEGRLRQWRWFRSIEEQVADLRIEAPMAFLLQPYLEYGMLEFGLTVPAKPAAVKAEGWTAGGINYRAADFGAESAEPWMGMIGKQIGGNEVTPALAQWLEARKSSDLRSQVSGFSNGSRSWAVSVPTPSPVVIDFINGEGLSFVKRFNGSFVTASSPVEVKKAEEPKPRTQRPDPKSKTQPVTAEEFMIHVRAQNGNLFEVYPTRMASPEWQAYQEPHDNFTMSFYGRAELPWRFKDNKPASLVVVMYPRSLPATYEFRRVQLIRIGEIQKAESERRLGADGEAKLKAEDSRYGQGKVILYNFSGKPVTGRLQLPEAVVRAVPDEQGMDDLLTLAPMERREIIVSIKVPWGKYERTEVPITFVPGDKTIPPARFLTAFLPDIGGLNQTGAANLLHQNAEGGIQVTGISNKQTATGNRAFVANRPRVTEEAPIFEQDRFFSQKGAKVEATAEGFTVTVTETPPGKEQRVEVEIPWPDGRGFAADEFLSLEFRLAGPR